MSKLLKVTGVLHAVATAISTATFNLHDEALMRKRQDTALALHSAEAALHNHSLNHIERVQDLKSEYQQTLVAAHQKFEADLAAAHASFETTRAALEVKVGDAALNRAAAVAAHDEHHA